MNLTDSNGALVILSEAKNLLFLSFLLPFFSRNSKTRALRAAPFAFCLNL
jgi:hypothetical protein